jgi:hypothetical protein
VPSWCDHPDNPQKTHGANRDFIWRRSMWSQLQSLTRRIIVMNRKDCQCPHAQPTKHLFNSKSYSSKAERSLSAFPWCDISIKWSHCWHSKVMTISDKMAMIWFPTIKVS